ncbi:MAG: patatin-like phospholipase family protein [Hyphomicrobium sp.]
MNLALQGGGAHGAFTWGVLDRLLEDDELEINWVSATSAGAVNAVALASGLSEGGKSSARNKLRSVWEAVHKAGVPDLMRLNPWLYGLSRAPQLAQMASLWSPYEFNPLGFDPLRRLLAESIDFEKLRKDSPIELLIAATEVASGRARIFRRNEITVDAVLASACLPTLHHAVEIDGAAYWDGGFSANPDIKDAGHGKSGRGYAHRAAQLAGARGAADRRARDRAARQSPGVQRAAHSRGRAYRDRARMLAGPPRRPARAVCKACDAPLPSDRSGSLHRRAERRQHDEARLVVAQLSVRRRA